jgi:glycosyltransferase involved in cell wall biosynthesis
VLEIRDIWPESAVSVGWLRRESAVYRALEKLAHDVTSRADTVLVPTPGLEPLVRAHGARRVETLTGFVVPRSFDRERRARARRGLQVSDEECLFVYAGAIGVANGIDLLLDAVRRVPRDVRARVVIAGDGSARRSVEEALRGAGLDRVDLLPPLEAERVDDLLAAGDVGLHLLRPDAVFESALPTKVLEYFGAGLPFVTTIVGLPAEIARASGGAAVTSADELAQELERWAAETPAARRERGRQALEYGLEHFGLDAGIARLEALLEELTE